MANPTLNVDTDSVRFLAHDIADQCQVLEKHIKSIQECSDLLKVAWDGVSGRAARNQINDIIYMYKTLLTTVESTYQSLNSSANSLEAADQEGASMFK